jgi:hypothetical protein
MSVGKKVLLGILLAGVVASVFYVRHVKRQTITLSGAVITRNDDPRKELPIAGVKITAQDGTTVTQAFSDASGLFTFKFRKRLLQGRPTIKLGFRNAEYEPLDLTVRVSGDITVAALTPIVREKKIEQTGPVQTIGNLVVRYSIKTGTEMNVGSAVRSFEVSNQGNVPCMGRPPCSPDGKWKASSSSIFLDAGNANEFRNGRASCIAGPCPFTSIDTKELEHPGQTVRVSATAWSDTATFLVEAEVVHPMVSDIVRYSYPVIFGDALNFTLPPAADGVSIQADVNGQNVVFPLGPALLLSWADCNARTSPDHRARVYRCELKPGYRWLKTPSKS